jgi:NADH-quinone oxidoreductase subunit M
MSILEIIILLPLIAAGLIGLGLPARLTARAATLANLALILAAAFGGGSSLVHSRTMLENPAISFAVGADGMSLVLALLTGIVTVAAAWNIGETKPKLYPISTLLISGGALGAFLTTDIFFMYAFHELALIPTLLMIAIHGQGDEANRTATAWKITVYLGVGSLILLAGLMALVLNFSQGSQLTFDLATLLENAKAHPLPADTQAWLALVLIIGFGTLVSLFPLHSWAAPAYATAPTPVAMMHSGVLKKFGLYGLIKVALPLLPAGFTTPWVQQVLLWMLMGNILIVGFTTLAQTSLDRLLGNSSVMHMGYIFLGIAAGAAGSQVALQGAVLLMFAHGISIALAFALCGRIRQQVESLEFKQLGGLAQHAPFLTVMFAFATFASIGLPGLANFAGEVMIFLGTFSGDVGSLTQAANGQAATSIWEGFKLIHWAVIVGLWGVVMSAVYMLRAYRDLFFGKSARGHYLTDPTPTQRFPLLLLAVVLLVIGCYPSLLLNLIPSAVKAVAGL